MEAYHKLNALLHYNNNNIKIEVNCYYKLFSSVKINYKRFARIKGKNYFYIR